MEDVKEQEIIKKYLEKERFTQKFDNIEKMKNEQPIKELTNQEFLNLFKKLPEQKELKELLIEYKDIFAILEQDMQQIPREIAEFSIPLKEGMEPKDMEQNPQEDKDEQIKKSLKKWLQNQIKARYIVKVEPKSKIGIEWVKFAANLIHVPKKGKTELRHCANMTRLNECTEPRTQRIGKMIMCYWTVLTS